MVVKRKNAVVANIAFFVHYANYVYPIIDVMSVCH